MPGYRIYSIAPDDRIIAGTTVDCADDAAATAAAQEHLAQTPLALAMEVWQRTRLVRRITRA